MGKALFYHLTRSTVEELLARLLERALAEGWRVVVRGADAEGLRRLDDALWLGPEDRFLPHGLAGGAHDALQPVLLTQERAIPDGTRCLALVHGGEAAADEVAALERVWIVFDGADPAAVERARAQWKALSGAGLALEYWSEADGSWRKARG